MMANWGWDYRSVEDSKYQIDEETNQEFVIPFSYFSLYSLRSKLIFVKRIATFPSARISSLPLHHVPHQAYLHNLIHSPSPNLETPPVISLLWPLPSHSY